MNVLLVAALLAAAPPSSSSSSSSPASDAQERSPSPSSTVAPSIAAPSIAAPPTEQVGGGDPIFTRDEPSLAAARRALDAGDADLAVDRARAAVSASADERAVVEYDAAQALRARARKDAQSSSSSSSPGSSARAAQGASGGGAPEAASPSPPPNLDEAIASFERAAGLAVDPRLQSEARLAAGNAALEAGKLDEAIAALRKALVADPKNDRARHNLQRALLAKKARPPPPPQQDGDQGDDQKNDDQKQDQQRQDQQRQDQQKQDQQKQDQQKQDQQKQDQQKQDQQKQDQQKEDQAQDDDKKQETQKNADDKEAAGQGAEQPKPKKTSKDEKRRLLEGLRSRERPLTPLEMRGVEQKRAREGKDW